MARAHDRYDAAFDLAAVVMKRPAPAAKTQSNSPQLKKRAVSAASSPDMHDTPAPDAVRAAAKPPSKSATKVSHGAREDANRASKPSEPVPSGSDSTRSLKETTLYLNRELSQLEFNARVLAQAQDSRVPLLERVRYLCITSANLDEFFEVRVATLREQMRLGTSKPGPDGVAPTELLAQIRARVQSLVRAQYGCWNNELLPALEREGIRFLPRDAWNAKQKKWLHNYFLNELLPVLNPHGLDPAHPFPRILNKTLNFIVSLKGTDAFGREGNMALVRAPRSLPRIIRLPPEVSEGPYDFLFLGSVLQAFLDDLFPGMTVKGGYPFRVTRDAELDVDEGDMENLATALREELLERRFAEAVRLEITDACPKATAQFLSSEFKLGESEVYRVNGPVNLNRVMAVYEQIERPDLKFPPFVAKTPAVIASASTIFDAISKGDVLLHHPFESFNPVQELVRQASLDPDVLAIKQTLYRTGRSSPMVNHLIAAARAGKDVMVVIELRARFDEEANLSLADRLQEAGVQVVHGVVGFKTHAKMLLVVRREGGTLKRYVHLSTGNYHAGTANVYTDFGLMSCDRDLGEDMHKLFQQLSGLGPVIKLKRLLQSPFSLHPGLIERIEREATLARAGKTGRIIAKMNALQELGVIHALYAASNAGVQIDLIVRGQCVLRPGIAGVSANIRVRSIVGQFLEHSRIYYFGNDGDPELYLSSADWMDRNLLRRIEVAFPVLNVDLAKRVFNEGLESYLVDNTFAWTLDASGAYTRVNPESQMPHTAQNNLLSRLCY
jgi:polyphosphate kinase